MVRASRVRVSRGIGVLPSGAWLVIGSDLLSSVGTGMTLPFLVVYLHTIGELSYAAAGGAAALVAVAGLVGNPLGGLTTDRAGPRLAVASGLGVAAAGACLLAGVHTAVESFAGAALSGLGVALAWPGQDALLARLVKEPSRVSAYGLRYATMNGGLAVGALIAAVWLAGAGSFRALYVLDAVSFALAVPLVLRARTATPERRQEDPARPRYRTVCADRALRRFLLLTALLVGCGYAQFNTTLPVVAVGIAGLRPERLSLAFAVNTICVMGAQAVSLRYLKRHRRTSAIAAAALSWAGTWAIVLTLAHTRGGAALCLVIAAAALFAVGETLIAPSVPAIVNDLAPERLRGGYNAASALAYTVGFAVGPALGGLLLGKGYAGALLVGSALACVLGAAAALRLARELPPLANGIEPVAGSGRAGPHGDEVTQQEGIVT
jgi:MFS family permease